MTSASPGRFGRSDRAPRFLTRWPGVGELRICLSGKLAGAGWSEPRVQAPAGPLIQLFVKQCSRHSWKGDLCDMPHRPCPTTARGRPATAPARWPSAPGLRGPPRPERRHVLESSGCGGLGTPSLPGPASRVAVCLRWVGVCPSGRARGTQRGGARRERTPRDGRLGLQEPARPGSIMWPFQFPNESRLDAVATLLREQPRVPSCVSVRRTCALGRGRRGRRGPVCRPPSPAVRTVF